MCPFTNRPFSFSAFYHHPTAGFFSSINQTRISYQLVNAAFGGHEYWVGPGAAVFIKTYSYTKRLINYRTNPYSWVVAGTHVAGSYKATNR